mmetsp:Transcript_52179/g.145626  ORF Transcript_52179/g.145626 Transcript_52179/m.145626 type:complete len:107 (+) Transcript_52179:244-564(+)
MRDVGGLKLPIGMPLVEAVGSLEARGALMDCIMPAILDLLAIEAMGTDDFSIEFITTPPEFCLPISHKYSIIFRFVTVFPAPDSPQMMTAWLGLFLSPWYAFSAIE